MKKTPPLLTHPDLKAAAQLPCPLICFSFQILSFRVRWQQNHTTSSRISNYLNDQRFWPLLELKNFHSTASCLPTVLHLHFSHNIPAKFLHQIFSFLLAATYKLETLTAVQKTTQMLGSVSVGQGIATTDRIDQLKGHNFHSPAIKHKTPQPKSRITPIFADLLHISV